MSHFLKLMFIKFNFVHRINLLKLEINFQYYYIYLFQGFKKAIQLFSFIHFCSIKEFFLIYFNKFLIFIFTLKWILNLTLL
jgi:hypothetical protein